METPETVPARQGEHQLAVAERVALRDLVPGWLLTCRTENTRDAYRRDLKALATWLADRPGVELLDATEDHLNAWARWMTEVDKLRPSTVARRISSASSFYGYAKKRGAVTSNPAGEVTRPRSGESHVKLTPALSTDGARALLAEAERHGPRDEALVLLLTIQALRVSEALALNLEDVQPDRGHQTITVAGKGGMVHTVSIGPRLVDTINRIKVTEDRAAGAVLTDSAGRRWNRHQATRALRRLGNRAGIGPVTPHMLRATGITEALEAGVPLRDVQDLARHADPATTRRYDRARSGLERNLSTSGAILGRITD